MKTFTINRQPVPLRNGALIHHSVNERIYSTPLSQFVKPRTQYTKSGDVSIAYQVFGSGTVDLVYIPGWVSNIDWMWSCPELVDFLI